MKTNSMIKAHWCLRSDSRASGWCLLSLCQSLSGFSEWQIKTQQLNSWHAPKSRGRENRAWHYLTGGALLSGGKNGPFFGIMYHRATCSHCQTRHCTVKTKKAIEKGDKDDIFINYGCVPILFVCVPVYLYYLSSISISQGCKWGKAGQKNRRRAALRKPEELVH